MRLGTIALAAALSFAAPMLAAGADQTSTDFYSKNNVTLIVGAGAGGGYDLYSRVFAKYFSQYIPGHPAIVVKNMAGAGGINAAEYLSNVAPKDGSVIEMPLPSTVVSEALRPEQVRYRLSQFKWIGTISTMTDVLGVKADAGVATIADAEKRSIVIGSTNKLSETNFQPVLVNALIGTKFKIVDGYRTMNQLVIAMDRGEVEGHTDPWSSWITQRPKMIKNGQIKLLLRFGPKLAELPNVPALRDLVKSDRDRNLVDFVGLMQVVGRSLAAPPGTPADRVAALRQAFDRTLKDQNLIRDINNLHIPLRPRSGMELEHAIDQMMAAEKVSAIALKNILKLN